MIKGRRMTKYLVDEGAFKDSPMIVVDVGVRGGAVTYWDIYGDQLRIIGFEPDEEECKRLRIAHPTDKYLPWAVGRETRRKRVFYDTLHQNASSFHKPDWRMAGRFPWKQTLTVQNQRLVRVVNLEEAIADTGLTPDFIKLDCEGAELEILEGAKEMLKQVLGISVEALFTPVRFGQPAFSQIDIFLKEQGFTLFDMTCYRHMRRTLSANAFTSKRGQILWGQILYFKDRGWELGRRDLLGREQNEWNDMQILKLASLFEVHKLSDCAIELIQQARSEGILSTKRAELLIDLLTPLVDGKEVTFEEYWEGLHNVVDLGADAKAVSAAFNRHWASRVQWV